MDTSQHVPPAHLYESFWDESLFHVGGVCIFSVVQSYLVAFGNLSTHSRSYQQCVLNSCFPDPHQYVRFGHFHWASWYLFKFPDC